MKEEVLFLTQPNPKRIYTDVSTLIPTDETIFITAYGKDFNGERKIYTRKFLGGAYVRKAGRDDIKRT